MKLIFIFAYGFIFSSVYCQLIGGWKIQNDTSIIEPKLFNITNFLAQNYSVSTEEDWAVDEILSHQIQIVAGTNHKIVVQLKNTTSNKKIILFTLIEESLLNGDLILNQLYEIIDSNEDGFDEIKDQKILDELKEKIVYVHEYFANGNIIFNISKIRWVFSISRTEMYYVNYEMEGTNNESSLWEHWFMKSAGSIEGYVDAIDTSLFAIKLPLGKYGFEEFENSQDCSSIRSYLMCSLKNCSNIDFLSDGKCQAPNN